MKKAAKILLSHKEEIMNSWENTVKKEISASKLTSTLALRNQLPHVLNDIIEILNRYNDFEPVKQDEKFEEIISNSIDHGRHRATSMYYDVQQVIKEYIVFHRTLTDVLMKNDAYSAEVGILLKYTIETAMLNSATSFSDSLQEMREKLVGTLAHDMRNPLTAANLALDMIKDNQDEKQVNKLRQMAKRSLQKSIELIEGLLDAISVKAGEGLTLNFAHTDILPDIKWVYKEAAEIYSNPIKFECSKEEIVGIFDTTAVRRVLENLLTNAIKYGAADTLITIKVEDREKFVEISVHNTGLPIPEEKQEEIFQFLTTENKVETNGLKSWGMGLTLVKVVAEAHGGNVHLKSNPQEGTKFTIYLGKYLNEPGKIKTEVEYLGDQK